MQSILEALYYGHLCPGEKPPAPGSDAEKDQAACYASALQLDQALSGEDKALFEAFAEANQAFCEHSCCEYFCDGFRLGARTMLEVLQGGLTTAAARRLRAHMIKMESARAVTSRARAIFLLRSFTSNHISYTEAQPVPSGAPLI